METPQPQEPLTELAQRGTKSTKDGAYRVEPANFFVLFESLCG